MDLAFALVNKREIHVPGKCKRRKLTKLLEQVPGDIDQLTACLPSTEKAMGSIKSTAHDPSPQVLEAGGPDTQDH